MDRIAVEPGYESLAAVLDEALTQAQAGKGKERHADGEVFEEQVICEVARRVGMGYPLGQAVKKIYESERLPGEKGIRELLGAINYLAAAVILVQESLDASTSAFEDSLGEGAHFTLTPPGVGQEGCTLLITGVDDSRIPEVLEAVAKSVRSTRG